MNKVTVIRAISNPQQIKRVAGYARVSTKDEHQDSSFNLQIEELERAIKSNPLYEYVGVFKDKKSGTDTKGRTEFNAMIDLATLGEIDIIITKSITRFARNIVDTIKTVRTLKSHNVEVIFLKENISTLDSSIEFILSVLAVHAEEESRNISENVKWSVKRKMRKGGNFTTNLFGYKIEGETWTIVEDKAKIVRMIFDMYINGKTYKNIIDKLFDMGVKTATGKDRWHPGTIESMLLNEKYAGHMSLGKTFIYKGSEIRSDRFSLLNNMIRDHHPAIVSPYIFEKALELRNSRTRNKKDEYVPLNERVTPYYQFVYSDQNERFLRYIVERPKGKYVIPTLFCYNKEHNNRVMITVKNLFAVLNDALSNLSKQSNSLYDKFNNFIESNINKCDALFDKKESERTTILSNKASLIKSRKGLLNYYKRIINFKEMNDVEDFRKLVYKVTILDQTNLVIKLSLNPIDNLNLLLYSSDINLKIGSSYKDLNYTIFL